MTSGAPSGADDPRAPPALRVLEGGCLCGEVRYRVAGSATGNTHCHCQTCRRSSGAPFVTWAGFPVGGFEIIRGVPTAYRSSSSVVRQHCAVCGTQLTYWRADSPDSIDITLSTLDDPGAIEPRDHTWVEQKVPWISLTDGLPQHAQHRRPTPPRGS